MVKKQTGKGVGNGKASNSRLRTNKTTEVTGEEKVVKPTFAPLSEDEAAEQETADISKQPADNEWVEVDSEDSDDELPIGEYEDEDEAEGAYLRKKGTATAGPKSSQPEADDDQHSENESDSDEEEDSPLGGSPNDNDISDPHALISKPLANAKPLTAKALAKFQEKQQATGVVYLSRIPPFMRPVKLRQLLARYGALGRIYLAPEDPKITARRKKYRKNKRQNYTEGWVEFLDKKVGRRVAEHLNGKQIGGKKRSFYYDDLWNMKYLPKFKWNHLTEQIAYELKVREQRLKTEMAQAKKETKEYVKNVERAKMVEAIEERKRDKKRKAEAEAGDGPETGAASAGLSQDATKAVRRQFKQRKVVDSDAKSQGAAPSRKKAAVLSKLFG
ncbi:uncharacterized protein EV422DRAFT_511113 [Fimicolochytrium jonesii]|uniref:uncharacterized protein n=1 Tax=Fimicolochytrium jonesii TaxID=1396493 RepID=UPI0022FF26D6|nr:uncharacterized protein EV422DRAFT_511113 [Fimicolochytrium jonesii]KAI8826700.1 hypothetical protein EV422DRAFT_511113 [Fimicolochytrium jonesii]